MKAFVVFAILLGTLFALAYFTKRRFGVLGLALCAGALLSGSWTASLTPFIEQQGVTLLSPPLSAVVAVVLTLLPAILLLFSGPAYTKTPGRIVGAVMFALLAFVFLLSPLGTALVFDSASLRIYDTLVAWSNPIVVAGIAAAITDLLLTRTPKNGK